jgi:hypothetical protein
MSRSIVRAGVCMAIWLAGFTASGLAQGVQTGTLRGTVLDQQGLPIPAVTVTLTSPALQGQRSALTAADGGYVFTSLPPGPYEVSFESTAFSPATANTTVPLGLTVEQNVTLKAAGVTEAVQVVAEVPSPIATSSVGLNIRQPEVEALATSRTLFGIATLSPAVNETSANVDTISIHGQMGFDNNFMINGVDVNDNLFGSPQDLFIEEAIQETQVLTSGISAEFGRFTGGVVNAITKSGGNSLSGSYRVNLTNPAWVGETPFEKSRGIEFDSRLNHTHEATVGGPVILNRLWFFGAGRVTPGITTSDTLKISGIQYQRTVTNQRGEIKLTGTVAPRHTVQGGYLNNHTKAENTSGVRSLVMDPRGLVNPTQPNEYYFTNYRGILRNNLLAEAQYSHRTLKFQNSGGTSTAIVDSPFRPVTQESAVYNAPYFDATDPEARNNRQLTGSLTSFFEAGGRHEVKTGYEWFRSQLKGGNSQSSTNYIFFADFLADADGNPQLDSNHRFIPVFEPNLSFVLNWQPIRGATLNVDTQSVYARDHWTINRHVSADLGFRFERVRSEATGGLLGVDTNTIVPRLAVAVDPRGDGNLIMRASYGHYAGRYNETLVGGNSNVGNPDLLVREYLGPAGQGVGFAPGFDQANYLTVDGEFPTANVFLDDGLSSPVAREATVSIGGTVGPRGYADVTYVWRRTSDFIDDITDIRNGATDVVKDGVTLGRFTNTLYSNSDLALRKYQALVFQGRYNLRPNWTVNGFWTLMLQDDGNYQGEATNQPAVPSPIGDYPEAFNAERHYPFGRLPAGFQKHRVRLWTIYNQGLGRLGEVSLSGLLRVESGQVYSLVADGQDLSPVQTAILTAAGYPNFPTNQDIFFGKRGSQTFKGYGVADVSLNYNIAVMRKVRPFVKLDVFNVFNNRKLISWNTTVVPDPNSPLDALGLPTGYKQGPGFGRATSSTDYPGSLGAAGLRTVRLALGMRF